MKTNDRKWIAFDAAGTLFETAEPVENVYADCFSTLGFGLPESTWKTAFHRAYEITPDPMYGDSGNWDAAEKQWWRDLVGNAAISSGIRPDPATMDDAFGELFAHFASGSAWKLFPETHSVLSSLKAKGIGLAIVSNFDSRLHGILGELGIAAQFDHVITSADVGARKPSPTILSRLMETTAANPADCCLVGDSLTADGGAAEAAAMPFFHIDRPRTDLAAFAEWHEARFFPK
ncbi:HAD-IA family hydrolase [Akkermansiaceae bacterium]|nr:HAD-IA family hydrolase [Akkermansiaceae bacterium]